MNAMHMNEIAQYVTFEDSFFIYLFFTQKDSVQFHSGCYMYL